MADATRRGALSGVDAPRRGGACAHAPGVEIRCRPVGGLVRVHGADRVTAAALRVLGLPGAPDPGRACAGDGLVALRTGPQDWLVVAESDTDDLCRRLRDALSGGGTTVTDLGHARTRMRLEGARVRDLLAKGCPVDVEAMRPGDVAGTLFGTLTVELHCRAEGEFDLYVARSFGLALWEILLEEAAEFGYVAARE